MKICAAVAQAAGQPLSIETVDLEGPHAGEVLVHLKATGVCHTDAYTLSGKDPEGLFPAILGHEGVGVVMEAGPERARGIQSVLVGARWSSESLQFGVLPGERRELAVFLVSP